MKLKASFKYQWIFKGKYVVHGLELKNGAFYTNFHRTTVRPIYFGITGSMEMSSFHSKRELTADKFFSFIRDRKLLNCTECTQKAVIEFRFSEVET